MLYLAKHGGYPSHGLLRNVEIHLSEAGYLVSRETRDANQMGREQHVERDWQSKYLLPMVEFVFHRSFGEDANVPTSCEELEMRFAKEAA